MATKTLTGDGEARKQAGFWYRHSTLAANLILIGALILYLTAGAFAFLHIEGNHERQTLATASEISRQHSDDMIQKLRNMSRDVFTHVATDENFTSMLREQMEKLATSLTALSSYDSGSGKGHVKWTYASSLFFCTTVITTIGYGNIVPVTVAGRVLCIFYAIFGIPLLLLVLSILGNRLASPCKGLCLILLCKKMKQRISMEIPLVEMSTTASSEQVSVVKTSHQEIKKPYFTRFGEVCREKSTQTDFASDEKNEEATKHQQGGTSEGDSPGEGATICLVVILLILYLAGGALLYSKMNSWSYIDSLYFVFVTLSTIGFGDIMPESRVGGNMQFTAAICFIYVFIGLSIMSTVFSLAQNSITKTFNLIKGKCNG